MLWLGGCEIIGTVGDGAAGGAAGSAGGGVGGNGSSTSSSGQGAASSSGNGGSGQGAGSSSSGQGAAGGSASSSTSSSGSSSSSSSSTGSSSSSSGNPTDPYDAERQACIDHINQLRATKGRPAMSRWTSAEACVDSQATQDEANSSPHGAFGQCSEMGQNECLGGGPNGIVNCLDMMWAEKDQPGCAGCDACANAYDPNCPNCDFYGNNTGDVCGHYVNMSANYFSKAACGFSSNGGWAAIDFH